MLRPTLKIESTLPAASEETCKNKQFMHGANGSEVRLCFAATDNQILSQIRFRKTIAPWPE
jgi:hypothetical protein